MKSERLRKALVALAVAGPVLLALLIAWTPGISFTEDLGRHLLLGRIISEEHFVPKTNYLTYTHPDHPFVNHHWLSEVVFYQVHRAGGYGGLTAFKMLAMAGALALSLLTVRKPSRLMLLWLAGILAAILLSFRSHIRPELFTFLGVAFFMFCFERIRDGARWPWFATIIAMWLWSNTQIYFIFGLFMCVAFAAEKLAFRRRSSMFNVQCSMFDVFPFVAWPIALITACTLNPNGFAGLLYPFHIFSDYAVAITENDSVLEYWTSVVNPMMLALPFASALALWSVWTNWKTRPANSIIVLTALAASWQMARSVPLLALTLVPTVAATGTGGVGVMENWSNGRKNLLSVLHHSITPSLLFLLNTLFLLSILSGSFHRPFPSPIAPMPFGSDDESRYLAVKELQAAGLPGEIFTDYNIGSLAEYNLWPKLRGYVDNRPEAFPGAFWRTEYNAALALGPEWEIIRARRGINTIIVSLTGVKDQYTRELMRRPEWVLVHIDSLLGVWVSNAPAHQDFLRRTAFTTDRLEEFDRSIKDRIAGLEKLPLSRRHIEADRAVYECYALICVGQTPRAWPHIWALHQLYPDYQIVHELMRVSAPAERVEDVKRVMQRRARWPVAAKQALDWGHVLESEGHLAEAHAAYRRARFFFPLSPDLRAAQQRVADALYQHRDFQ